MKPENMKCFEEVQRVIGYEPARIELQKVIDNEGLRFSDEPLDKRGFRWASSPQRYAFWSNINRGQAPEEYTSPKVEYSVDEINNYCWTKGFYKLTGIHVEDMLQVGMTLEPNIVEGEVITGFGVIIKCEENTFEVLTDFGNKITLTKSELLKNYKFGAKGIVDVKERLQVQIKLLGAVLDELGDNMITWKREDGRFSFSDVGYLGKYKAFEIIFDGMSHKFDNKKQKLNCFLNGIKPSIGNFLSVEEAKEYAESKVMVLWLKGSGLQVKGE